MGQPGPVYLGRQHQREEASQGPGMQIAGGPPSRAQALHSRELLPGPRPLTLFQPWWRSLGISRI